MFFIYKGKKKKSWFGQAGRPSQNWTRLHGVPQNGG